jgi:PIN domain nuclease of toxin-antitoxin system
MGTVEGSIRQLVQGITIIPVSIEVAILTVQFPPDFSSDPTDRIIAATARAEGLPLLTADQRILSCSLLKTIW